MHVSQDGRRSGPVLALGALGGITCALAGLAVRGLPMFQADADRYHYLRYHFVLDETAVAFAAGGLMLGISAGLIIALWNFRRG